MDKRVKILLAVVIVVGIGLASIGLEALFKPRSIKGTFLGGVSGDGSFNMLDNVTQITTSTASGQAVLLLARNYNRAYAAFVNDSATPVYLTFKNFASANAASTSVGAANGGVRINANGGTYEILPQNMIITDVWASSTASGLNVLVTSQ